MHDFVLSCCSPVDLPEERLKKRNIPYLPFRFTLAGKEFKDDLGKSISYHEFYQAMRDGAETKTSQINVKEYYDYFKSFLENGKDLLHVTLSSGLSGTYNSALIAAKELKEQFPDRKIFIVDSLAASSGYGLLIDTLADLRDSGMNIEEVYAWAEEHKKEVHHWFFSADLTFYVRGGRISKASGWFGSLLKICPLLNMSYEGKLVPRQKIRGKKNVIKSIVDKMVEHSKCGVKYNGKCYISHSESLEDALQVKKLIEETFPNLSGEVLVNSIGTTIGSHSGPGTVALFFLGDKRTD